MLGKLKLRLLLIAALLAAPVAAPIGFAPAAAAPPVATSAGEPEFRSLYKQLVETNTTRSAGSCTLAAERMAARLKAAGYADDAIHLFAPVAAPSDGGLVAILPGSDPQAGAVLLLAHIDVVEAKREDWQRDPFVLVEENGNFYGRGTSDDKAQAAIFTDAMVRLKAGKPLRRTLKLALTCGEEGGGQVNGVEWLVANHRDWITADFALNEGGSGSADAAGKPLALSFQAGEKVYLDFRLETTNPGGHSSRPRPDNAIYSLAAGLVRLGRYEFPVQFSDTTRAYFAAVAPLRDPETTAAIKALLANPEDSAANAIVSRDASMHSTLRTTCVATLLDAGHATNALPQRARANVNCRMFPGDSVEKVRGQIIAAIADPAIGVTPFGEISPTPPPPPLTPLVYDTAKAVAAVHFPGVTIVPTMLTGATDGRFLNAAGIPTYGMPGSFRKPDGGGVHGLDEYVSVAGLMAERAYLFDLIQRYASARQGQ
jgi:acetylornithine deacetylase/succinyl-diaminopimelate desuccinylase-like protein